MNSVEYGLLSRRTLNFLVFVLFAGLVVVLITSERGVSGVLDWIGNLVTRLFGQ
jgi:hypothetical protein